MSNSKNKVSVSLMSIWFIIAIVLMFVFINNNLVEEEEKVFKSWAQVESNYQRRADLIPNLVKTVRIFMDQEKDVLVAVVGERSKAMDMEKSINALIENQKRASVLAQGAKDNLGDDEYMKRLALAQQHVGQNVSRLFGLVESYPDLRSSEHVLALQYQLEGTENRINVARMRFNQEVGDFNTEIRKIPASLIANMGDFQRKAYFKSDAGADKPVDVNP